VAGKLDAMLHHQSQLPRRDRVIGKLCWIFWGRSQVPGGLLLCAWGWPCSSLSCAQPCDTRVFVPTMKTAAGTMGHLGQGTSLFVYSVDVNLHKTQEFARD